jgi:ribosome-interacting GTPase 1
MPTNLPPDYYEIEKRFREAESSSEKVALLEQMYSVVPKHKGTDHLRADLRRQLSRLKEEALSARRHAGGHTSTFHIEREGAGQAALIGAANSGKSALLAALTNAEPEVSPAPYTTWKPAPGMMPIENIQVQLVDTPALDRDFVEPELFDLVRRCDQALLIVDLQADPLAQLELTLRLLGEHRLAPAVGSPAQAAEDRTRRIPMLALANKCDTPEQDEDFTVLRELYEGPCPLQPVSALTGRYFDGLKQWVLAHLGIVRVYARPPGKEPDLERPFVLKQGSTVDDLTRKVHKDFYEKLKYARVWGGGAFDGQMVQRDYVLKDGDVIELHI